MSSRPRIKINLEPIDRLLDIGGFVLLCLLWIVVYYYYTSMPDTIATHFDGNGEPNSYGEKTMLFIAPAAATITFFLLYFLNKAPHLFNFSVTITEENAPRYYLLATRVIRMVNICMLITFFAVSYTMITGGSTPMVIIIATMLPILPIIWYFIQTSKLKNK